MWIAEVLARHPLLVSALFWTAVALVVVAVAGGIEQRRTKRRMLDAEVFSRLKGRVGIKQDAS